jgi:phage gpG-like protein
MANNTPNPFNKIAVDFRKFIKNLPNDVSHIAEKQFKQFFVRQGYVNANGIFIPWKKRSTKKGKRDSGRGILIKSGRLKRSIRAAALPGIARVVTDVPYAKAHNEGVTETVSVKAHQRNRYKKVKTKIKTKSGKERNRTDKQKTGSGTVKSHSRKMNLPARPFMVHNAALDRMVGKIIDDAITKIWNKA